jgi:hypothetical protein
MEKNKTPGVRVINFAKFLPLVFILAAMINFSCSDSAQPTNQHQNETKNNKPKKSKPPSSYSDTIKINSPAAVFFYPDSMQLEKIRTITEPTIFESQVHEFFYQMRNSRIVLQKYYPNVKIIEVKNARYLQFIKQEGKDLYYDLNTQNDPFGVFLFDGLKSPALADMTNIDSELGFYFSKK